MTLYNKPTLRVCAENRTLLTFHTQNCGIDQSQAVSTQPASEIT